MSLEPLDLVTVEGLWYKYDGHDALRGVSFSVRRGEVFGVLGPNGAGKTTLLSILTSQLRPTGGRVFVLGLDSNRDAKQLRPRIGLAAHELRASKNLPVRETLEFYGLLYGLRKKTLEKRVQDLLTLVGLETRQNDLISAYSEGMRRRLNIALALVHEPEVVFLDEPTMGLDPHGRRGIWRVILDLSRQGKTVILTTHYMEEAEFLCDRVALIDRGKVVAAGTPAELKGRLGDGKVVEVGVDCSPEDVQELLEIVPDAHAYFIQGLKIITTNPQTIVQYALKRFSVDPSIHATRVVVREPSLEDVFLELTGRSLGDRTDESQNSLGVQPRSPIISPILRVLKRTAAHKSRQV